MGWRVETTLSSVWEHGRQFLCTCCKEVTSLRVCTQYQPSGLPRRPSAHVECRRPRQELRQRATSAAAGTAECRRRGAGSSCLAPHTPSHPPTPASTTARPRSKVTRWSGERVSRWNEIFFFLYILMLNTVRRIFDKYKLKKSNRFAGLNKGPTILHMISSFSCYIAVFC